MSTEPQRQATSFHKENLLRLSKDLREQLEGREFEVMNLQKFDFEKMEELHNKQTKGAQMFEWINNLGQKHFPEPGPRIQPPAGHNGMKIIQ